MTSEKTRTDPPSAVVEAMQGLAFWIGYQHRLFPHHDLVEGAVVAEMYRLLDRHIDRRELLVIPECSYARLRTGRRVGGTAIEGSQRADIVVAASTNHRKADQNEDRKVPIHDVRYVMEVKRSVAQIQGDILRLHQCLVTADEATRAFLVLVSQAGKPRAVRGLEGFVDGKGNANRKSPRTLTVSGDVAVPIRVRRVCKASASFKPDTEKSTHYVTLIEVLKS